MHVVQTFSETRWRIRPYFKVSARVSGWTEDIVFSYPTLRLKWEATSRPGECRPTASYPPRLTIVPERQQKLTYEVTHKDWGSQVAIFPFQMTSHSQGTKWVSLSTASCVTEWLGLGGKESPMGGKWVPCLSCQSVCTVFPILLHTRREGVLQWWRFLGILELLSLDAGFGMGMTKEEMKNASEAIGLASMPACAVTHPVFQKAATGTSVCSLDLEHLSLSEKNELTKDMRKILEKKCRSFTVGLSNTSWWCRRAHNRTTRARIPGPTWKKKKKYR